MPSPILLPLLSLPIVFVAWLIVMPGGESALTWFEDIVLFAGAAGAALATLLAALRYRGTSAGWAWALVSLGMFLMAFGEGAWGYQELLLGQDVESPAVADIGYLGFYIPVFLGLLMMPQAPVTGLRRVRLLLDTAIAIGAIAIISSHFLISDLIDQSGGFSTESVITIAYPILDLAVVFAAIVLVARGGRNLTNASVALVTAGLVCIAFSDSIYTYLVEIGEYGNSSDFDTGWVIGYTLIAVGGMLAAGRQLNLDSLPHESGRRVPIWQAALFHLPLVPVAALLFLDRSGTDLAVDVGTMAAFVFLVGLAFGREIVLHMEGAELHRQVQALAATLQEKVRADTLHGLQRHAPAEAADAAGFNPFSTSRST